MYCRALCTILYGVLWTGYCVMASELVLCTLYCGLGTMYWVLCTGYYVLSTLYWVLCTGYSAPGDEQSAVTVGVNNGAPPPSS